MPLVENEGSQYLYCVPYIISSMSKEQFSVNSITEPINGLNFSGVKVTVSLTPNIATLEETTRYYRNAYAILEDGTRFGSLDSIGAAPPYLF